MFKVKHKTAPRLLVEFYGNLCGFFENPTENYSEELRKARRSYKKGEKFLSMNSAHNFFISSFFAFE
jgi:hypothetical protein